MPSASFEKISDFLLKKMRMSHVYQPVMIRTLLESGGSTSVSEIAKSLLLEDRSQIEYYEQITKNMVGRVLTKNRGITAKSGSSYSLNGFEELSDEEIHELLAILSS